MVKGKKVMNCFLCLEVCPAKEAKCEEPVLNTYLQDDADGQEDNALKKQLQVIFLLRKILEIPQEICCTFLKYHGDPNSWINCCPSCWILVQNSKRIFDQMLMLQKEFKSLQNQMKTEINQAVASEEKAGKVTAGVRETIRSFLLDNENLEDDNSSPQSSGFTSDAKESSCTGVTSNAVVENQILKNMKHSYVDQLDLTATEKHNFGEKDPLTPENMVDAKANGNKIDTQRKLPPFKLAGNVKRQPKSKLIFHQEADLSVKINASSFNFHKSIQETERNSLSGAFTLKKTDQIIEIVHTKKKRNINDLQRALRVKNYKKRSIVNRHEMIQTGEKQFECEICGKCFATSQHLIVHQRIHTGEKPFECDICGKTFSRASTLGNHKRNYTGEKGFECEICGKTFSQAYSLKQHTKTHTGEKPFECGICGKAFSQLNTLINHKRTHTGDKPFECNICGKAYLSSNNLTIHKRSHTGEKPFECAICGKTFSRPDILKAHTKTHTGEKPFKCDICGNSFSESSYLTKHKRAHTGEKRFECDICGKAFTHSSTLSYHKVTHTGEKAFECDICGKAFALSKTLSYHKTTHTGEKPFECFICGKKFPRSYCLKLHTKTHIGKKAF